MTEATCRREIDLEIPAENVQKTTEKIARDLARVARIPGFRPGKAPVTLIRRRFAEEIKGEVLESLVPEFLEQALTEKKLTPVTRPQVDKVDFTEAGPLKVRATFEVLPEFELGDYKNLEIEVEAMDVGDAEVDKTLEEMRERAATYIPAEGRTAKDDDFVQVKLIGTPAGGGEPIRAENVQCHIGAEDTLESFNENLRGAAAGETRRFETKYPDDFPDPKLAGKTYHFAVEVRGIKEKKLPELNDDFVKDIGEAASGAKTLEEFRGKIREQLTAARDEQRRAQAHEKILEELVKRHDFPVPQALIEQQMDVRLERVVRSLSAQGVDPRAVNLDWVSLRHRQHDRAERDVKAEILLDRIASAEKIEASDEDLEKEIASFAERSGDSAAVVRARLTKQGALDRMKSKLRSDKAIDWLHRTARIQTIAKREK
ncbi:MAG TPA: trigger factor [Candidatus Limnocylindrales bacterium]|nr:trigger factor [Candidatus Limnocylindrales bacterium]